MNALAMIEDTVVIYRGEKYLYKGFTRLGYKLELLSDCSKGLYLSNYEFVDGVKKK